MKLRYLLSAILVALFIAPEVVAQDSEKSDSEFKISAEYRTRGEYRDGYKQLSTEATDGLALISHRVRIALDYKTSALETRFTLQDIRAWGQTPNIDMGKTSSIHPLLVYEAWAKYNFSDKLGLKVGRQEISYGDHRLLWVRNWNNYGATHDAAVLQFADSETTFDFGLSASATNDWQFNNLNSDNYQVSNYRNMAFVFFSKKFGDSFTLNITDLALGYQKENVPTTVYVFNTLGPNIVFRAADFKLDASFYHQHGKSKTGSDVNAMMYTANATYDVGKLAVTIGYDSYSGKAYDDTDNEYKTFNPFHYAGHRFLGNMDYFIAIPSGGITDLNLKISAKLDNKTSLDLHAHSLGLAQEMKSGDLILQKSLGQEIDLGFTHKFGKGMVVKGGYSFMLPTESMEVLKGVGVGNSTFSNWAWVMLIYKPTLFSGK